MRPLGVSLECTRSLYFIRRNICEVLLFLLLLCGLVYSIYYLSVGLNNPLLDYFAFRQTQTAITTYWLHAEGFSFTYQTPVLGYPWEIPFEFPIYQYFVSILVLLGFHIDVAGRIVSFAFFVSCLVPLKFIFDDQKIDMSSYLIVSTLFLFSPLYVFWSRTFMIESAALFFSMCWLALIGRFLCDGRAWVLVMGVVAGILGILTKSTTFAAFGLLGVALIAQQFWMSWMNVGARPSRSRAHLVRGLWGGVACLIVLAVGLMWVAYTDAVKELNPLGEYLVSKNLQRFNFGPLDMRLSAELWEDAMINRAIPETFGYLFIVAIIAAGAAMANKRYALPAVATGLAFLVSVLLFTNLHRVHNYYQYANALFLIVWVGLGLAALAEAGKRSLALIMLLGIVGSQLWFFQDYYAPIVSSDLTKHSRYRTGMAVRSATTSDQTVLVFGDDWSSAIPYYAERKGLALPFWASTKVIERILENPQAFLEDRPLGAVVSCGVVRYGNRAPLIEAFLKDRPVIADLRACQVYAYVRSSRRDVALGPRRHLAGARGSRALTEKLAH